MRGKVVVRRKIADDGQVVDATQYFLDRAEVTKEEYDERFPSKLDTGMPFVSTAWGEPLKSMALACHPEQVQAMNERNKEQGVKTRYDATGMAHIPTREDRNRLLRVEGKHDNDGSFGDQ